jgi:hydrogenase nickel incorporation protein HypA/HybF
MHEFTIAISIVEIAETSALKNGASQVSAVEVDIGEASGVVKEALEFAWESATASSTLLKKSGLILHSVPVLMHCNSCENLFSPDELFDACPGCGEISVTIIQGRELKVKSITVEDR